MKNKIIKGISLSLCLFAAILKVDAATVAVGSDSAGPGANGRSVTIELRDADLSEYSKVEFQLSINGTSYASLDRVTPSSANFSQNGGVYTLTNDEGLFATTIGNITYSTTNDLVQDFKITPVNVKFTKKDGSVVSGNGTDGLISFSAPKSTDASLSNLSVSQGTLSPQFSKTIKSYTVSVPDTVNSIKINATTNHSKATKTGVGQQVLNMGANVFEVVVTAEDGATTDTYTITVNRGETLEEIKSAYLSSLIINNIGCTLSPEFDKLNNKYTVDISDDITSLDIKYTTEEEGAKVEIDGNRNFVDGENLIKVTVTSSDSSKQVYEIIVNKGEKKETEAPAIEEKIDNKKNKKVVIVILVGIATFLIIGIGILIFKKKSKNKDDKTKEKPQKEKSKLLKLLEDDDDDEESEDGDVKTQEIQIENVDITLDDTKDFNNTSASDELEKTKEFNFKDFK